MREVRAVEDVVGPEKSRLRPARGSERDVRGGRPDPDVLRRIIRRIVEVAAPEKIILFGSAARGEMNWHSDVDLLVIKSGVHRLHTAERIHENLWGVRVPVDVVVATPEDLERYGDSHCLVYKPALRDGKVVYVSD